MLVIQPIKTDYDAEILDIKSKYLTTADYNRFSNEKLDLEIKQKGLISKFDIADLVSNAKSNKEVFDRGCLRQGKVTFTHRKQ